MSMIIKRAALAIAFCGCATLATAQTNKNPPKEISIGPFGSKPIQLTIDKNGIKRKEGGYICDLKALNAQYSEWGETEKDARLLVMHTCNRKSGLLLCKKDKITCKQDKP